MQECVNCHVWVMPKGDGTCPSCRARVDRVVVAGPQAQRRAEQTLVTVGEHDRLPAICCRCARPTERRQTFRFSRRTEGTSSFVHVLLLLISPLASLMQPGVTTRVRIVMPLCEVCRSEERLQPRDVRFEDYTMQFRVHREFRRQVEAVRRA